jgi:hypothetical protein
MATIRNLHARTHRPVVSGAPTRLSLGASRNEALAITGALLVLAIMPAGFWFGAVR